MGSKYFINSLLKTYSIILIAAVTLFALIVSYNTSQTKQRTAMDTVERVANQLENSVTDNEKKLDKSVANLMANSDMITSIYQYFELEPAAYLQKSLSEQKNNTFLYLPRIVTEMYYMDDDIESISISLNDYKEVYYSTKSNKGGKKYTHVPVLENQVVYQKPLKDPNTLSQIGIVSIVFNDKELERILANDKGKSSLQVAIISDTKKLVYYQGRNKKDTLLQKTIEGNLEESSVINLRELEQHYYIKRVNTSNDFGVLAFVSKKTVTKESMQSLFFFLFASAILDGILLFGLRKTFKRYVIQVEDIQKVTNQVSNGNMEVRIVENAKQGELKDISHSINQMLDSINRNIEDIYNLEIKQKDANMRALQSQIDPHFLYNTLEYIRMYAVSEGAEELSNVVYVFGSLLRNSITQEKVVTIRHELEFCEKYAYLYQMRYRDRIAYGFQIEKELGDISIPKFSIQPLVENFFVHGIDHTRKNNTISVKVSKQDQHTCILIKDNGTGVQEDKLMKINELLKTPSSENKFESSIGIQNVNARLRTYFGDTYSMTLKNNQLGGLTIEILF
ncbi:signal transduction histidine kinase, LytS [Mycobacteroides abscessus subsp. abscessus]|nr:signal transduction histidine kinase, LytS [Mycobacteroides abscessus subsp. abscessus]HEO8418225.1 sensor histidine kinase [Yersinia enterocolitica]